MATKSKVRHLSSVYNVSAKLKLDVGMTIEATSLEEAVAKSKTLKINDFIDFSALGIEHNDSDEPDVYSVWRNDY
jgi:hypothetical protein